MTENMIMAIYSLVSIFLNLTFIGIWKKREGHSRDEIRQNLIGMPFFIILGGGIIAISPYNDAALGIWLPLLVISLIPFAIGYCYYALILPAIALTVKDPRPKLYWINIAVLFCEAAFAPLIFLG